MQVCQSLTPATSDGLGRYTCSICQDSFKTPVRTKCGHVFCEVCHKAICRCVEARKRGLIGAMMPGCVFDCHYMSCRIVFVRWPLLYAACRNVCKPGCSSKRPAPYVGHPSSIFTLNRLATGRPYCFVDGSSGRPFHTSHCTVLRSVKSHTQLLGTSASEGGYSLVREAREKYASIVRDCARCVASTCHHTRLATRDCARCCKEP